MIRRLLTENLGLKIFSLVMGLVIFLAVRNEQEVTTTLSEQILLRERADLINTADLPGEVLVRVTGSPGAIASLATDTPRTLELDLGGLSKGVSTLRVREDQLGLPPDARVVSISPSLLTVHLEPRDHRKLPVKALVRGEPADGFEVGEVTVDPPDAEVEGPTRELRDGALLRTAPIDVEDASGPIHGEVAIDPPGQHTHLVQAARAQVTVEIRPAAMERVLELSVRGTTGPPVPVRARIRGPRPVVEHLDPSRLTTRAASVPGKSGSLTVQVSGLPDGVELVGPPPMIERPRRPRG